ncbi:hypothetical protein RBWH47_03952 [Rhodopirellula baltica WH47]|uniref:Uncharacterized protein n=1 Tax=Rhodopirellula baltica WH47 TaxID=991778 RepID=F2ATS9_RHOBT|nr:hypothetical protein RBWH47_03952 [Rhodopirellula baltica WH47]
MQVSPQDAASKPVEMETRSVSEAPPTSTTAPSGAFHANLLRHYSHLYPDQHDSQLARFCRSSHTRRTFLREREQTLFRRP